MPLKHLNILWHNNGFEDDNLPEAWGPIPGIGFETQVP